MYFTSPVRQGRLHSAFLEKLQESETKNDVLPYAVPEYTLYEAALLGGSDLEKLKKTQQQWHRFWRNLHIYIP